MICGQRNNSLVLKWGMKLKDIKYKALRADLYAVEE